ncbi:hypothetical protein EIP91_004066 [Steccherinum ochraceum]|uniref:Uncharacterized protein n=1 Tax=Steccherinum ochraceum TaxID=92696 RepID=A0A4R0RAN8_9APHY|nr:hypothetical protein EIP91_004066 [Steccherinum ochraceum]
MPVYGARYQAINNRWRNQLVEDLRSALKIDRDDPDRVIQVMYQGKVLPEDPLGIRVGERTLDVFPPPASLPVKPIVGREVDMKAWGDAVDRWIGGGCRELRSWRCSLSSQSDPKCHGPTAKK